MKNKFLLLALLLCMQLNWAYNYGLKYEVDRNLYTPTYDLSPSYRLRESREIRDLHFTAYRKKLGVLGYIADTIKSDLGDGHNYKNALQSNATNLELTKIIVGQGLRLFCYRLAVQAGIAICITACTSKNPIGDASVAQQQYHQQKSVSFMELCIYGPILEELLVTWFLGTIFPERWGKWAIPIFFGALHYDQGIVISSCATLGNLFRTRNFYAHKKSNSGYILPSIISHCLNNTIGYYNWVLHK